jgi:hypothetical protein
MSFRISDLVLTLKIVAPDHAQLALEGCGEASVAADLISCEDTNKPMPRARGPEAFACDMGTTAHLRELQEALRKMSDNLEPIVKQLEGEEKKKP